MNYKGQYLQDKFVDLFLNCKKSGVFLDIGANDGITFSNSYFFEKNRKWTGICIEPIPSAFEILKKNRSCKLYNCCISDMGGSVTFREVTGPAQMLSGIVDFFDEEHIRRIDKEISLYGGSFKDIQVQCRNINDILAESDIQVIDYCSIDTEGVELQIVKSINFDKICINVFTIENNTGENEIRNYMKTKGYSCIPGLTDDYYIKGTLPGIWKARINILYFKYWYIVKAKINSILGKN